MFRRIAVEAVSVDQALSQLESETPEGYEILQTEIVFEPKAARAQHAHFEDNERVAMVAHVQEPGANDDASGCATLLEMARPIIHHREPEFRPIFDECRQANGSGN